MNTRVLPALAISLLACASHAFAQARDTVPAPAALKTLSLEQLMDIEVSSVSRHLEKLSATASAIQVITGDEIRRSGATSLPEALRLASNLQVAQVNASQWAVSARGFDNVLANKLLVLIDGRTVYTPLYAGVFWDAQNPPLENIDRIEVISGPGGALWGANAVNGVINVITKSSAETQGLSLMGAAGNEIRGLGTLRYGGKLSPRLSFRVYGQGITRGSTLLATGANTGGDSKDDWLAGQAGMRTDWSSEGGDHITLQSDFNDGRPNPDGVNDTLRVIALGGNALGRWTHTISESSDLQLQVYYDRTWRDFRNGFTEDLATYDADLQHRFQLAAGQEVTWGLGTRLMDHHTENLALFRFLPDRKLLHLYTGFVQDEITLAGDRVRLALGTKVEHNDYTGYEIQPSGRLAWTPNGKHTVWAAVSRGVRTPSRIDRDFSLLLTPTIAVFTPGTFQSEEVLAYELGWRSQAAGKVSLSLSTFYNQYDNIRSAEPGPPPFGLPITIANGVRGHTYGTEVSLLGQVAHGWRLRGGYTFLKKDLVVKPGSNDANKASAESDDPEHQFVAQSSVDLPGRLEWDAVVRYVAALPNPLVAAHTGLDMRLGWNPVRQLELSVVGQNLLYDERPEFKPSSPTPRLIERSVYGKVTIRW